MDLCNFRDLGYPELDPGTLGSRARPTAFYDATRDKGSMLETSRASLSTGMYPGMLPMGFGLPPMQPCPTFMHPLFGPSPCCPPCVLWPGLCQCGGSSGGDDDPGQADAEVPAPMLSEQGATLLSLSIEEGVASGWC